MKTAIEQIEAMRYKLRMMGIPMEGPTNVFCDNESVFINSTHPESTLKKKHNVIFTIAHAKRKRPQSAALPGSQAKPIWLICSPRCWVDPDWDNCWVRSSGEDGRTA